MNLLQKYKDQITSIGSIATALGVLIALGFSVNSLVVRPKKPKLDLLKTKVSEKIERLVIYNGGNGACAELSVKFPETLSVAQIVNYETSWHTNAEFKDGKVQFSPRVFAPFPNNLICKNGNCTIDAGFLKPDGVFPIQVVRNSENSNDIEITVSCINAKESIKLF